MSVVSKEIIMSLKKIISGISTFPSKNAWVWKDSVSVLSFTLFHLLWIIRLFSLLQIIKYIYRKIAFCIKQFSLDKGSKRINIPVLLVELYFIFFALGIFFVFRNKYILFYYLIESSVWLLYYNVFRRFYEEKYSICHQMEYFVLIPVVFFSQAMQGDKGCRGVGTSRAPSPTNALCGYSGLL